MELTQRPTKRLEGAITLGLRWLGSDTDHSLPSSAKGRMPNAFVCIHGASKSKFSLGIE